MNLRAIEPIFGADGEVIRAIRTTAHGLPADLAWLETNGHKIFKNLLSQPDQKVSPYQRPENVLRRSCYIIGVQIAERDLGGKIEGYFKGERAKTKKVKTTGPSAIENPFFWCFHLIQNNDTGLIGDSIKWPSRDQKTKSAKMLMYAYRNKVPPQHLTGFLLQIGMNEVLRLADQGEEEVANQANARFEQNKVWRGILRTARSYRNRRKKQ